MDAANYWHDKYQELKDVVGIDADGAYFLPDRPGVIDQAAVQRIEHGRHGLILSAPAGQTLVPLTGPVSGILATAGGVWRMSLDAGAPPTGSNDSGSADKYSMAAAGSRRGPAAKR